MSTELRVKNPVIHTIKVAAIVVGIFAAVALLLRFSDKRAAPVSQSSHNGNWHVYFSPNGGCTEAIVNELQHAKDSVFIHAYSFTSKPIAQALVEAKKRNVRVSTILDKSQASEKYSEADFLDHSEVRTLIDAAHAINHNKVIVIDGETVITGSFNFTGAAEEKNAENLLVVKDKTLAQQYTENWYTHAAHSHEYKGK